MGCDGLQPPKQKSHHSLSDTVFPVKPLSIGMKPMQRYDLNTHALRMTASFKLSTNPSMTSEDAGTSTILPAGGLGPINRPWLKNQISHYLCLTVPANAHFSGPTARLLSIMSMQHRKRFFALSRQPPCSRRFLHIRLRWWNSELVCDTSLTEQEACLSWKN